MVNSVDQKIEDLEVLKKIVNKELDMSDIDFDTKIRLIELCDNRINDINSKIDVIDKKIDEIKNQ